MKKVSLSLAVIFFTATTFAQKIAEKNVPASVKKAFQQKYPTATSVKWDKETPNYEASFDLNKIDNSVLIDAKGNIIETEVEISLSKIPKDAKAYIAKNYAGKKATEAAQITNAKGIITYEVEIKGMDIIFDSNGNFIKEVKG